MKNIQTDLERVRNKIISRQKESHEWDRFRFFIEIKEVSKFLEDIFKNTVPVVSGNVMEFFNQEDLCQFYNEISDLSITTANTVASFDKLLGERQEAKRKELGIEKESAELVSDKGLVNQSEPNFDHNPLYVV